jgi:hypothetical protein
MARPERNPRLIAIALSVAYWLVVLVISSALVVALIAWLNARDESALEATPLAQAPAALGGLTLRSVANATSRWEAL